MKFRTEIETKSSNIRINHQSKIVCMGSCFAERIGDYLSTNKINTLSNPLGILYNPVSLSNLLRWSLRSNTQPELSWAEHMEYWHSFDLHSQFTDRDKNRTQERIEKQMRLLQQFIPECNQLIITFGTAIAYKRFDNQQIVANCHKYPADFFQKIMLSVHEAYVRLELDFTHLFTLNPDLQIILTVSPVRHTKEGLANNSVSKATLLLLANQLDARFENVEYFPAYEIMNDDLRDYRFYHEDMIHPSEPAVEYIWHYFQERYMSSKTQELIQKWEKVSRSLMHRPLHPYSSSHLKFLKNLMLELERLKSFIPLEKEIEEIQSRIKLLKSQEID